MEINQNNDLRKQFKALRNFLSDNERDTLSKACSNKVLALLDDFKGANIFLCFYPFGTEIDLRGAYQSLLDKGKSLYFPVSDIDNHALYFYNIKDLQSDFHQGFYGIMEPNDGLKQLSDFDEKIIAITPGLAFDSRCNRMGYGAGFYDRFFEAHPDIIKVGVAFDLQVIEQLETKPHDVALDYIVTDKRLIKRSN